MLLKNTGFLTSVCMFALVFALVFNSNTLHADTDSGLRPYLGEWRWVQSKVERTTRCSNINLAFHLGTLEINDGSVKRTFDYTAEKIPSKETLGFNLILVAKDIAATKESKEAAKDCNGRQIELNKFKPGKMQFVFIELSSDRLGLKLYHEGGQRDWFKKVGQ